MVKRIYFISVLLISLILISACAQGNGEAILMVTDHKPEIDGKALVQEYSLTVDMDKMKASFSRDQEFFYFAISGQTTGWIAIGFGSGSMDNSQIIIAYVIEGNVFLKQELGKDHSHSATTSNLLFDYIVEEEAGQTIIEGVIQVDKLLSADDKELQVIAAFGAEDNFDSYHQFRKGCILIVN